jgi:hypothetical protein
MKPKCYFEATTWHLLKAVIRTTEIRADFPGGVEEGPITIIYHDGKSASRAEVFIYEATVAAQNY